MIGILCGLHSEAKIADKIPGVLVGCSGARQEKARALADYLIEQGVKRLVSFGICGALSPDLAPGDLLLGATVMSKRGAWEADPLFNQQAVTHLNCYSLAPIWGSEKVITNPAEKASIYRQTGCLAADMESQIVARAAAKARIPFNVIRAVADTSTTKFPPAALLPLLEDGKVDFKAVFSSIVNQPKQLPDLITLGHHSAAAHRALKTAVTVIRGLENDRTKQARNV